MRTGIKILLITCTVALSLSSCGGNKSQVQRPGAVLVNAYTVTTRHVVYYDSYPGTVAALNETDIRSQVGGYVTGIFFKEGSRISKGQALYEIDRTKYQAALEQSKATVSIATANLDKAQRDADRYTALNEQNAIAKQVYDDAMTNLENAKMQLITAKSALINAQTDFNYSRIKAPYSGTIGFSYVRTGAYVVPGQTLLTTVSSDDPIGVDFIAGERMIPVFTAMKDKEAHGKATNVQDSTFRIVLSDNRDYGHYGRLSVVDRAVDNLAGTIKIRIVFPNSQDILKPGMNCVVKVLNGASGDQIVIPYKAVIEQMSEYFVYKIDSGRVKEVKIEPGLNLGAFIEVKNGLNAGDNIVLEGLQKVFNGSMVQIAENNPSNPNPGSGKMSK